MTEEPNTPEMAGSQVKKFVFLRKLGKFTGFFLVSLLLIFITLNVALRIPVIQNYTVILFSSGFSNYLGTENKIESISLSGLTEFRINKVFFTDPDGDTLLFADKIYARLHPNLFKLFNEGLIIHELKLSDVILNSFELDDYDFNSITWIIKQFENNKKKKKSSKFKIYPELFVLNGLKFTQNEPRKKIFHKIIIPYGFFKLDKSKFDNKSYHFLEARVDYPYLYLKSGKKDTSTITKQPLILPKLDLAFKKLTLNKGNVVLENGNQKLPFSNVQIEMNDICYLDGVGEGGIKNFSFKMNDSLELKNLEIAQISLDNNHLWIYSLAGSTGNSFLRGDFNFSANNLLDFSNLKDKLKINFKFRETQISILDFKKIISNKKSNSILNQFVNENLIISGIIDGNFNKLVGSNLNLKLSGGSFFSGKINVRNLFKPREEFINLTCKELFINQKLLYKGIKSLNLDSQFTKLEFIRFKGSFDGFTNNFVTYGNLNSNLGGASLDLKLDIIGGKELAKYSGKLGLKNFKLGRIFNYPDLGNLTFDATIKDGRGFSSNTAFANISATIQEVEYKKYTYKKATLVGLLDARKFRGDAFITDPNINFSFGGIIDFTDKEIPKYNFSLDLKQLNLKALNLSKEPLNINGKAVIDLKNKNWSDLEGIGVLFGVNIKKDTLSYYLDNLSFISKLDNFGKKSLEINSEILDANFQGNFDVEKIPNAVKNILIDAFPSFSKTLDFKKTNNLSNNFNLKFTAKIKKSSGWENFLLPQLSNINGSEFNGEISVKNNLSEFVFKVPQLNLNNIFTTKIYGQFKLENGKGSLDASIGTVKIGEQKELPPFIFVSKINKEEVNFRTRLGVDQKSKSPIFELNGKLYPTQNSKIAIKLGGNVFKILSTDWKINSKNLILLSNKKFEISDLELLSKGQKLTLINYKEKGIKVSFRKMDLSRLDSVIKFPIKFSGSLNGDFSFEDWKGFKNLALNATSDSLFLNKKDWGYLKINAKRETEEHPVTAQFSLVKGNAGIFLSAFYNLKDFDISKEKQKGYFDLQLNAHNFPNNIANVFLEGVLSNITGRFDADLHFDGNFPKLNTGGTILLSEGGVTVDFLKTNYTYKPTLVKVDNQLFDLTGGILYDKYNHPAQISGGVSHNYLKKFGFKAKISSKKFLCLDTQKGDNPNFYGQAMGTGDIFFSGIFRLPDIYVKASVADSTKIIIPISSQIISQNIKNIRFVNKQQESIDALKIKPKPVLKGLSFDMDLEVKSGAALDMVFNEQTGDILKVKGRGGVRLSVLRNEPFKMFGDISIDEGSYLFTYLAINKNFKLKPRGTISWNGDPFKALINIEAIYDDIYASTAVLIQENLSTASQSVKSEASQNTPVTLILKLQGDLFKPKINFDLAFPALQGALANYVESKLRVLKQDQNELNKQVFGLIVAGQFLPAVFSMSETTIIYNTVSEFVSNQLSLIVNQLISNLIGKGDLATGTNFDIAYNRNPNFVISDFRAGNELQVSLKQSLFNERLTVLVGGNLDNNFFGGSSEATTFLGNDVVVEYDISKDKSLKFRVYQKLQPDFSGRRLRFGAGISYRKEFESFADFLNSLNKK